MINKCLIINGSPKPNGNTAFLIKQFCSEFDGEVKIVDVFPAPNEKGISSCLDCGGCHRKLGCAVNDDFKTITSDNYNQILIVSPIYMSNLPGPMINLLNRFNYIWCNKQSLGATLTLKPKQAKLILLGGGSACESLMGENNEDLPLKQAQYIFKKLNAKLEKEDVILALNTDEVPVEQNKELIANVTKLAKRNVLTSKVGAGHTR